MKTILVAGGAGFIGRHLCTRLLEDGNCIICVDNLSTGCKNNIYALSQYQRFTFIQRDICEIGEDLFPRKIDEIYNLACMASPIHYQADPIQTLRSSTIGVNNLLNLAKISNAKFLQASTSEVYGDPLTSPQMESYWGNVNPIGVRACYDEGKRCAETFCVNYHRQFSVPVKIVRIFNTYGEYMLASDGRVISKFMTQAISNKPITIYGDGLQTRSFMHVDDLIVALICLMNTENTNYLPMNIGNPEEYTILELAQKVINITQSKSEIVFQVALSDEPRQRCPDIRLIKETLNWQPSICLEDGLNRCVRYFSSLQE